MHPQWLSFFRVAALAEAVFTARAHGTSMLATAGTPSATIHRARPSGRWGATLTEPHAVMIPTRPSTALEDAEIARQSAAFMPRPNSSAALNRAPLVQRGVLARWPEHGQPKASHHQRRSLRSVLLALGEPTA